MRKQGKQDTECGKCVENTWFSERFERITCGKGKENVNDLDAKTAKPYQTKRKSGSHIFSLHKEKMWEKFFRTWKSMWKVLQTVLNHQK